eukprot:m.6474 g.6474  ORF g.6474 m.6474 type:complete len:225 (+) comp4827_c0_seq1:598-1272(+)
MRVSYDEFCWVWKKYLKHIDAARVRTDLCNTCVTLRALEDTDTLRVHLNWAKEERLFHKEYIERAQHEPDMIALSWDFSEAVRLPSPVERPKSIYFESGLTVDVLGIADVARQKQTNYILPEYDRPLRKGCDLVVSMLHDHIDRHIIERQHQELCEVQTIYLMADNSAAHAKNNTMIRYLAVRSVLQQQNIYLHFMVEGHTKRFSRCCVWIIQEATQKRRYVHA